MIPKSYCCSAMWPAWHNWENRRRPLGHLRVQFWTTSAHSPWMRLTGSWDWWNPPFAPLNRAHHGLLKPAGMQSSCPWERSSLKEAVARQLLKNPSMDPGFLSNYCRVSNLPYFGKMVDRALVDQFQDFLYDTSFLDPFPSGFWPEHRMETVLITLRDDLWWHLDWGSSALLLLLDLLATFDMVNHALLAHYLTDAGIQGTAHRWLISFLHGWEGVT